MSTTKDALTLHANHALIRMGGVLVGRLTNLTATKDSGADYVYEIGTIQPVEINHNRMNYRITAASLILRKGLGNPRVNRFPKPLSEMAPFTVEWVDRDNGTEWVAEGVEPVGETATTPSNQRKTLNTQYMALKIRRKNLSTNALPNPNVS